jgi:hypothetical protein
VKNLAFYETAAQVIPILFVVLALELRYFEPWTWPQSRPDSWGRWTRLADTLWKGATMLSWVARSS